MNQILGVLYLHFWPCMYNFGPLWISENSKHPKIIECFFLLLLLKMYIVQSFFPRKRTIVQKHIWKPDFALAFISKINVCQFVTSTASVSTWHLSDFEVTTWFIFIGYLCRGNDCLLPMSNLRVSVNAFTAFRNKLLISSLAWLAFL